MHMIGFYHSITSSARASSVAGISRPSAFAVIMLMTRSNLVGCSTAAQNLADQLGGAPPQVREVRAIGHQRAGFDALAEAVHRRQPGADRQRVDTNTIGQQ